MKWTRKNSRYVIQDDWATLRADTCVMPDGRIVEPYYVLEYPDWAHVVAVTTDDKVVLVRQYRHALGEVGLELPGGCVDERDTSVESAVRRELLEETGYRAGEVTELAALSPNPATHTNRVHSFLATGCELVGSPSLDASEDIEVVLVEVGELLDIAQHQMTQAMQVSSLFLAMLKLGLLRQAAD